MANMIYTKIMHNHHIPVRVFKFVRNVSCDIVVNFGKVLSDALSGRSVTVSLFPLTETKKLDVPSALENVRGKSLSQVSSPYMISLPDSFFII